MHTIHPTAIVEPGAQLGERVHIGPYSCIGSDVILGDDVHVASHVVVAGKTTIGSHTRVFPFASLGTDPQDLKYAGEPSTLHIGSHNKIREYVTMQPGTAGGNMKTVVGDHGLFMAGAHVAHDCVVGDHVIMANNATLGGHVTVGDYVVIGGLAAVHQFVRIGSHAMIGGTAGVSEDVIPYGSVGSSRAQLGGLNLVGLKRRNIPKEDIHDLREAFRVLFVEGTGPMVERLEKLPNTLKEKPLVQYLVTFIQADTSRPFCHMRVAS